jgi:hypothetical protein
VALLQSLSTGVTSVEENGIDAPSISYIFAKAFGRHIGLFSGDDGRKDEEIPFVPQTLSHPQVT